jgi:uncharacterized protein
LANDSGIPGDRNRLYCGNPEALGSLSRITDWAVKNLERSRRVNDTSTEWYTLSENLYRAYLVTGDDRYKQFAEVWEYHTYWDLFAHDADPFAPRPDGGRLGAYHAYSHVNTLGGAAAAFLVKGKPAYLNTIKKAYQSLQDQQCFATGGGLARMKSSSRGKDCRTNSWKPTTPSRPSAAVGPPSSWPNI